MTERKNLDHERAPASSVHRSSQFGAMQRAIRKAERVTGDGSQVSGTGLTILKFQEPMISRLIKARKIGPEELQAIDEIERVYERLCSKLILRGALLGERVDKSVDEFPDWFLDAYHKRYKPWADEWSKRRVTHGDLTLEIVFDILFSDRTGKDIDREKAWQNGLAARIFLWGVRDYAAMAGWVSGATRQQWSSMARQVFPVRRVRRGVPGGHPAAVRVD